MTPSTDNARQNASGGGRPAKKLTDREREFLAAVALLIKAARVASGLTGYDLAATIGVSGPTQFNRESGKVSFPIEEIARYAAALGVSPRELIPEPSVKGKRKETKSGVKKTGVRKRDAAKARS